MTDKIYLPICGPRRRLSSGHTWVQIVRQTSLLYFLIAGLPGCGSQIDESRNQSEEELEKGTNYFVLGDNDLAISHLNEAIRLDAENTTAYYRRGAVYLDNRDFDKAIADFSKVLRQAPDDPATFTLRGEAYAAKGEYRKAIDDFSNTLRLFPNEPLARWNRAKAYEQIGESASAKRDFAKAKELGWNE